MKAVITGDIIQSTRLSVEHRSALVKQIQDAMKIWETDFTFKSEFFRGDSFQCLLQHPHLSLRVSLLLKTFIRSLNPTTSFALISKKMPEKKSSVLLPTSIIDARIAVGIGDADAGAKLATSNGMAFSLSGHLLDALKNSKQSFGIATNDEYNNELETESMLLDALISKTTALQCEVINLKLLYYNETEIAKKLNIIQSAVNQRSRSGNWNAIDAMVDRFEEIYPAK
jgi:hypothetical protein